MSVLKPKVLMTSDNFANRHKTKILGLCIVTLGYLQLPANQEVIARVVGEATMPVVNVVFGLLALWFGFLNNPPRPEPPQP